MDMESGVSNKQPLNFAPATSRKSEGPPWKVLIADDDPHIRKVTKSVLADVQWQDRRISCIEASRGDEALARLKEHPDIAVVLMDVVMGPGLSGLEVVEKIRENPENRLIRIILRSGESVGNPPLEIFTAYDINDYREKSELTSRSLILAVLAALKNYRDLTVLEDSLTRQENQRTAMDRVLQSSVHFFEINSVESLAKSALENLGKMLPHPESPATALFAARYKGDSFRIIDGIGKYGQDSGKLITTVLPESVLQPALREPSRSFICTTEQTFLSRYRSISTGTAVLLYLECREEKDNDRLKILELYSSLVYSAFENILIRQETQETQAEIVSRLGDVVETRSQETASHVRRVSALTAYLAAKMGLNSDEIEELSVASSLHDIGKVGVPDNILLKENELTIDEFEQIKAHTTIGYEILKESHRPILRMAALIAHQHHERFDGSGYPNALKAKAIHLYSRIVSIADVFDALTHNRLYKTAWEVDDAIAYIIDEKEKSFDPELVELFVSDTERLREIAAWND